MSDELRACPKCKGMAQAMTGGLLYGRATSHWVECSVCNWMTANHSTAQAARDEWNANAAGLANCDENAVEIEIVKRLTGVYLTRSLSDGVFVCFESQQSGKRFGISIDHITTASIGLACLTEWAEEQFAAARDAVAIKE